MNLIFLILIAKLKVFKKITKPDYLSKWQTKWRRKSNSQNKKIMTSMEVILLKKECLLICMEIKEVTIKAVDTIKVMEEADTTKVMVEEVITRV